ncbi:ribosome biogenesis/translation initiation ATPase RLI [Candidatus Woesearchaeota archaeon]|nr:MAG: ribosome biogenesis/translation initiation ATPase RLI [Candidatus Woesearchaeota archaeon]
MAKHIVIVDKAKCNPAGCGGFLCMRVSPSNRAGKEAFYQDKDGKVGVNEDLVTDIDRVAVNKCPYKALQLVGLPENLDKPPIHRYGKNGFSLFSLPTPLFGKVVGIIGKNGLGKSTAVNILAGHLTPNFGREEATMNEKDLITYFKGTEAQNFFEKRARGEITVAYKPQQVERIPKQFKGTPRELLTRVDETKQLQHIANTLELTPFLDRDINHISGGELQRVAIAATALRKANVYFFDEPTSYLDIKQRLKIATFIRSLANENTAVMVVEHDLIILDAMTDLVHIMYGKEDAYGIVSNPRSSKAGINTYLSGYLREENIRFRQEKIFFERQAPTKVQHKEQLITWPAITKKLGDFTLQASQGTLNRNDVVGILGENGIGKTSFVNAIAKAEEGNAEVAYKPQYLETNDSPVAHVLKDALTNFKNQLINPLGLAPLLDKNLNELSGGQLQRVHLAATLAKKADLYLLDEPATYLDVEQRLIASKVIRDMMTLHGKASLIVDHDLLFIDYLCHKLIIFEGTPAKEGRATGPFEMEEGMNRFLKELGITFRRDEETNRPRANKPGSLKDREQKQTGKLYYT